MIETDSEPKAVKGPLEVRFWGVRGSVPSPGLGTVRYGGNTSCVEIGAAGLDSRVLLDAGTGLRQAAAAAGDGRSAVDLFVTHLHWDHIQGLPFFGPFHDPASLIRIHAPAGAVSQLEALIGDQMDGTRFPVRFTDLPASVLFETVDPGKVWSSGELTVDVFPAHHPGPTVGYRVRASNRSVAYFPDNSVAADSGRDQRWYDQLVEFVKGADLLIHDAMHLEAEFEERKTWGHSTPEQALRLASDAGVRTLCLFHHDPDRSDETLDAVVAELRCRARGKDRQIEIVAAAEGVTLWP